MDDLNEFYGPNAGYVLELYERYQRDPESVDPHTRSLFQGWTPPPLIAPAEGVSAGRNGEAGAPIPGRPGEPTAETVAWGSPALLPRRPIGAPPAPSAAPDVARVVGAAALAQAIREYGHLAARLDPLGGRPPGDPTTTTSMMPRSGRGCATRRRRGASGSGERPRRSASFWSD